MRILFVVTLGCLMLSACHRPIRDPQKSDPIYLDLQKKENDAVSQLHSMDGEIEKALATYETAPIRTGQRQDSAEALQDLKAQREKLVEKIRYFSIAAENRMHKDKKEYQYAFDHGKDWPDPQEYKSYVIDQKLANAPREWSPERRIRDRNIASEQKRRSSSSEHEHGE